MAYTVKGEISLQDFFKRIDNCNKQLGYITTTHVVGGGIVISIDYTHRIARTFLVALLTLLQLDTRPPLLSLPTTVEDIAIKAAISWKLLPGGTYACGHAMSYQYLLDELQDLAYLPSRITIGLDEDTRSYLVQAAEYALANEDFTQFQRTDGMLMDEHYLLMIGELGSTPKQELIAQLPSQPIRPQFRSIDQKQQMPALLATAGNAEAGSYGLLPYRISSKQYLLVFQHGPFWQPMTQIIQQIVNKYTKPNTPLTQESRLADIFRQMRASDQQAQYVLVRTENTELSLLCLDGAVVEELRDIRVSDDSTAALTYLCSLDWPIMTNKK